jgi:hypothetical protein
VLSGPPSQELGCILSAFSFREHQVTAKAKEVVTEVHLRELSQREAGRLQANTAKQHRARQELEDRVLAMQKEVLLATERMDQFKLTMNFNQAREQWHGLGLLHGT